MKTENLETKVEPLGERGSILCLLAGGAAGMAIANQYISVSQLPHASQGDVYFGSLFLGAMVLGPLLAKAYITVTNLAK